MARHRWIFATCWIVFSGLFNEAAAGDVQPIIRAHAHNDYHHPRPLLDALDHGFCSVEADVFLVKDKLFVGHTPFELKADRALDALYLDPLIKRVRANGGRVYPNGPRFILLIDFKSKAEPTYDALKKSLEPYKEMLTSVEDGKVTERAVTVVLSGNRPSATVEMESLRYVGLDGRPGDLGSTAPAHLMPMISDAWRSQFTWDGEGAMPDAERTKLRDMVARAHDAGRIVRFWAAPEKASVWRELLNAKVDLINTDDLPGLSKFLKENNE